ncbi:type II toxin-antitoxin system RelE/ParE family toxin [Thiovibrio frasassiensis]|uniref:Type II toxin-antitoxin system mRNA interferase toxin, RelE/StbE family n=1 Tax=Thiovibrio frasassiensis TaxID=2984131 RepID=A0A9X4MI96_9BACT|nr:type II toxin-antitoxin system mRNA interferase toxin, RelE/StbE family [Thiovibrio frasassiensis]MDG4476853.1 type II toxin-antitoxin system mRNA interferase toxin, RelE/StbE family [Thiovibrio frasassiensis]
MYTLVWTSGFTRSARKFLTQHQHLREKFAAILSDLERDPFQPHLRYHHLGGKLQGVQAISITSSYRLTLTILISEQEIILLDVGSHDEVYR